MFLLCLPLSCGVPDSSYYPAGPGNLFIRQEIGDYPVWKAAFLKQGPALKARGFSAYSLHRDLVQQDKLIVTLKCSDLAKAIEFLRSVPYETAMQKAGARAAVLWAGVDVMGRKYEVQPKMTGGIVIAKNTVRSYEFWKACWDAEGQHQHPDRGYKPGNYSIHHLKGNRDIVLVAHEASDVTKASAFMNSEAMKGVMQASGVTGIEIWYGINLEEGLL